MLINGKIVIEIEVNDTFLHLLPTHIFTQIHFSLLITMLINNKGASILLLRLSLCFPTLSFDGMHKSYLLAKKRSTIYLFASKVTSTFEKEDIWKEDNKGVKLNNRLPSRFTLLGRMKLSWKN